MSFSLFIGADRISDIAYFLIFRAYRAAEKDFQLMDRVSDPKFMRIPKMNTSSRFCQL